MIIELDALGKLVLAGSIKEAISEITKAIKKGLRTEDKKAITEAITSIQIATIKTRNFIDNNGYVTNEELTELWHVALNKVVAAKIGENLPQYLYDKAKFWGKPQDWINNPETLKLVPKLKYLNETCEMLLLKL